MLFIANGTQPPEYNITNQYAIVTLSNYTSNGEIATATIVRVFPGHMYYNKNYQFIPLTVSTKYFKPYADCIIKEL